MSFSKHVVRVVRVCHPRVVAPASFDEVTRSSHIPAAWRTVVFTIVSMVCLVVTALTDRDDRPFAAMLTLLFVGVTFVVLMELVMLKRVVWDGFRLRSGAATHFLTTGFSGLTPTLAGFCFTSAAAIIVWTRVAPGVTPITGPVSRSGGLVLLSFMGLGGLSVVVLKRFYPSGIRIDAEAVWVRQGLVERCFRWSELERATLHIRNKHVYLDITGEGGNHVSLPAIYYESNPYFVAELIHFYLRHPDRRELLRDPDAAIREVMEVA